MVYLMSWVLSLFGYRSHVQRGNADLDAPRHICSLYSNCPAKLRRIVITSYPFFK
jgi:hypothetical protein